MKLDCGGWIVILAHKVKKRLNETTSGFGVTGVQSRILGYILEHCRKGPVFQKDVEDAFGLSRSTATGILQLMEKPDVDLIEGLSPAIAIDQKATSHNPRSTIGTVTEIYDYLRLLFARVGTPHCPRHPENPLTAQSVSQMVDTVLSLPEGKSPPQTGYVRPSGKAGWAGAS